MSAQATPKRHRSIRLPVDVWDWLDDQPAPAARTVEALVRQAMGRGDRLDAMEDEIRRLRADLEELRSRTR